MKRWPIGVALATAVALLSAGAAAATPAGTIDWTTTGQGGVNVIAQGRDIQSPTTGQPVLFGGRVVANANKTVNTLIFACRTPTGGNCDFGHRTNVALTTSIYQFTAARSFTATGNYTVWIAYEQPAGVWTNLTPTMSVPVSGPPPVFSAPLSDTSQWTAGNSSAYPGSPPQTNPGDHKLDKIDPSWSRPDPDGTFRATKEPGTQFWRTDLVTTEYSTGGFQVRTGDTVQATITLRSDQGSWPAIWTWGSSAFAGHGEVDLFEYHSDNPNLLELTNHVGGGSAYIDTVVTPGAPFTLKVELPQDGVKWYVDGNLIYTGGGLPSNWTAHLIVNVSVADGFWHPAPAAGQTAINGMTVTNLQVHR